jgi:DNA-binding transcriptional ArsR family regulator
MASGNRRGMRKRGELAKARKEIDKAIVKGLANALRNQILAILNERKASATEIAEELGIDFWQVSYEMEVLRKAKLIKKVGERPRRGATEHFYEATARSYLDPSEWPEVADPIKAGLRASLFQNIMVDAATAITEEAYDSLENAHMSWIPLIVDEQGWDELMAILLQAMEDAIEVHKGSAGRLIAKDAEGISCTVSILGYPSANKKRKVGLPADADELVDMAGASSEPTRDSKKGTTSKNANDSRKRPTRKTSPKLGRNHGR